jgi:biopolymer transport protein TolQ
MPRANEVLSMSLKRVLALLVPLAFLSFATPGFAQSTPSAAPSGGPVQAQSLAAPANATATPSGMMAGVGDMSIVAMFRHAGVLVKAVKLVLHAASLRYWSNNYNKRFDIRSLRRRADKFEKVFWSGLSLDELYQQFAAKADHPLAVVFVAALREWRRAFEGTTPRESQITGIKERIGKAMSVTILRETDGLEKNLGFLATVGSVSPFIGLFGTVWGIMNSFGAIAARHDTTLAVVAPGIAEALFATAMGLLAAIPAVIFYNRFVNDIARYGNRLDAFADEFSSILSRQLEDKAAR